MLRQLFMLWAVRSRAARELIPCRAGCGRQVQRRLAYCDACWDLLQSGWGY